MQTNHAHRSLGQDQTTLIRDFASRCREKIEEFEKTQVRCGLIGPSGSGKSSLINAIAGDRKSTRLNSSHSSVSRMPSSA